MSREYAMKAQEQFLPTDQPTIIGTSLGGKICKILLNGTTIKNFMSKQYYLRNIILA